MKKLEHIKKNLEETIRGKKAVLLFTGDKGSALLINIINDMNVNAVFIDTGFHFEEILNYTEKSNDKVEIISNQNVTVNSSVDMNRCCNQRKTDVLKKYVSDTGAECLIVPFLNEERKYGVEDSYLNGIEGVDIIRPLADYTEKDIWAIINENRILFPSIYNKGFKIIDCKCCATRIGRKKPSDESKSSDFDRETVEKLKSLGYM